jgi:hypothetical protein
MNQNQETTLYICNWALRLANLPMVSSLQQQTKSAKDCNMLYGQIKSEVLSAYPWKIALTKQKLKPLYMVNSNYGYLNTYALPRDLLNLVHTNVDNNFIKDDTYIYANQDTLEIIYVRNLSDEELSLDLKRLIALKLAIELAQITWQEMELINLLKANFYESYQRLTNADAKSGVEVYEPELEELSWIDAR